MNSEGSVQSYPVPLRTYAVAVVVQVVEVVAVWQDQRQR